MEDKVLRLIRDYFNKNYYTVGTADLYIVWSCYILGNRKYLIGVINTDKYFEVTYNNNKKEWYIDEYTKVKNTCVKD